LVELLNHTVLVLDGRSRAALSIIRSLGRKDINVIVGESFRCASFFSRYIAKSILYPPPDKDPLKFYDFLISFISKEKIDFIIPVRDHTTEIICKNNSELLKYSKVIVPSIDAFNKARDKAQTIFLARKLGIPHPKTILPTEFNGDFKQIKESLDLPILLKPRVSTGSRGIIVIDDWAKLEDSFRKTKKEFGVPLIQEFIPHGGSFGVSVLLKEGIIKAFFTHKRIREFPPSGGPSTLREGIRYQEIEEYAFKLLQKLQWNGVAMVEFRIDKRTNIPKLMEINPRFWGSLQTAVFSGVDFPYLLYSMGNKGDIEPQLDFLVGRRVRWLLFGDVLWFLKSPNKIGNLKEFVKFWNKDLGYEIISLKDLAPIFGLFIETATSIFRHGRLKHVFKRGW